MTRKTSPAPEAMAGVPNSVIRDACSSGGDHPAGPSRLRVPYVSVRRVFDALHVSVGQAEMMADFMDQHVADQVFQTAAPRMPVGQDRAAIEKDHVHVVDDRAGGSHSERHAAIEAE